MVEQAKSCNHYCPHYDKGHCVCCDCLIERGVYTKEEVKERNWK